MTENPINDPSYKPFPSDIHLHDNYFERPNVKATSKGRMGKMFKFKLRFGRDVPHILFDGIVDDKMPDRRICFYNNTNETFANLDAGNKFKNKSRDIKPFRCRGASLAPVQLTSPEL